MRNRAKCKLCEDIIESKHRHDYVTCKCGQISVDGGNAYHRCRAGEWSNFLRVDDEGNIIVPEIKEKETDVKQLDIEPKQVHAILPPSKQEMLHMLAEMIKSYENLPLNAMLTPVTQSDLLSLLLLFEALFKSES